MIRLAGDARDYTASVTGSFAVLSDGDTEISIPIGIVGTTLVFEDGVRTLAFTDGAVRVGGQAIGSGVTGLAAPAEAGSIPTGANPDALGRVVMGAGASVAVAGNVEVFATRGHETLEILGGRAILDGSFGAGGDIVILHDAATDFTARISGSYAVLLSDDTELLIPIGLAGATLRFSDGDRELLFDTVSASVKIGDQAIGSIAAQLVADSFA